MSNLIYYKETTLTFYSIPNNFLKLIKHGLNYEFNLGPVGLRCYNFLSCCYWEKKIFNYEIKKLIIYDKYDF